LKYNTPEFRQGEGKLKEIPWNFAKFLVDSQEKVVKYYEPNVEPSKIVPDIEKLLH
jgi:glutathione peroxidase